MAATTVCPRVLSKITSGGAVAVGCVCTTRYNGILLEYTAGLPNTAYNDHLIKACAFEGASGTEVLKTEHTDSSFLVLRDKLRPILKALGRASESQLECMFHWSDNKFTQQRFASLFLPLNWCSVDKNGLQPNAAPSKKYTEVKENGTTVPDQSHRYVYVQPQTSP